MSIDGFRRNKKKKRKPNLRSDAVLLFREEEVVGAGVEMLECRRH